MNKFSILLFSAFSLNAVAGDIPQSVKDECTTNRSIYFETEMRVNEGLEKEAKRSAILKALGESTSNPGTAVKTFKGQWFYEYENEDAVFSGYKIRSHYLSVAIIYTPRGLSTIVCNSQNLKQTESSIHRKASPWKGTLDTNIRIEISNISRAENRSVNYMDKLDALKNSGFVTDGEYARIKKRIEAE